MTKSGWLLICWALWLVPCAMAQSTFLAPSQASPLAPIYWNQRLFFIPYQANLNSDGQGGKLLNPIAKVQLLSSRTGVHDWKTLEEAEPNVRGFSYHAPEDGEFWFALRHLDRGGQPWPTAEVRPQMRIVVDTAKPELTLQATLELTGEVVIRYEARDANLLAKSLMIEVPGPGNRWSRLPLGPPDIVQPNRLVGRIRWRPPAGMQNIEVRAVIVDRAGHRRQATTSSSASKTLNRSSGPMLGSPLEKRIGPPLSSSGSNPFTTSTARLPAHNWPANNRLPAEKSSVKSAPYAAPPQANPYTSKGPYKDNRTPTQLVGKGSIRPTNLVSQSQTLRITPLGADNVALLTGPNPRSSPQPQAISSTSPWETAQNRSLPAANRSGRVVNSRTFDIEYDLQSVGPWGVSKVELWGTHDSGQTWQRFATDADNRSPIRVTVSAAGTFGFRILVDGANSVGSASPQPGDEPELVVTVDLHPPTAKLISADLGTGNLADHLLVRWTAADTNLESRPIALFYSSYPNGPWSTIASGLENTGSYTWRIERHLPARFYLRLEVRDVAGNLATDQTSSPLALSRPQPKGRLRGVRSISESTRP